MGSIKSIKRMGDIEEPRGRPTRTSNVWLMWFPRRRLAARSWVKLVTHRTTLVGQPCSRSRPISRPKKTASKAPCTSSVSIEAFRPRAQASSTS
ncbi:uncharacterized protein ASPGLDRAFT_431150 [Aspergillus glaucus CBS 516.65]|uniref:Uncharacterized protein n=1 Tax=Aspergillus glaucus CBS 516.65 TaxID=1160497 RepID=A0A1L9VIC1_ASPGL|nr:hypothetical protein ASPGLDRAFT_431150 [Aspergillus glaucus CBS 516.65]OJJ83669.1 hypothetical protein ASPGLDRAFT_431150 [Aspergillus glaucus CBS 516.65]